MNSFAREAELNILKDWSLASRAVPSCDDRRRRLAAREVVHSGSSMTQRLLPSEKVCEKVAIAPEFEPMRTMRTMHVPVLAPVESMMHVAGEPEGAAQAASEAGTAAAATCQ